MECPQALTRKPHCGTTKNEVGGCVELLNKSSNFDLFVTQ